MRNTLIAIGLGIVALLLIVVVAAFVDVNRFRPDLERAMTSALGRKVGIGRIQLSVLSGSASAEQLSIADDPAFGDAPFVTAKSVSVGVDLLPLIVSRTLRVRSF